MNSSSFTRFSGAGALLLVAAIHVNWARGSAWPAKSRGELARAIIGGDRVPGPVPTLLVAGLLTLAALFIGGFPARGSRVQRAGAAGVMAVLAARALAGFAGLMPQERQSRTFRRWNRRVYSPLCLALTVLCSTAAEPRR